MINVDSLASRGLRECKSNRLYLKISLQWFTVMLKPTILICFLPIYIMNTHTCIHTLYTKHQNTQKQAFYSEASVLAICDSNRKPAGFVNCLKRNMFLSTPKKN